MKKIISVLFIAFFFSCSTTKSKDDSKLLYKVLVSSDFGGASFQFFEIITEQKEFAILLGDDEIKKFVKPNDINSSNFILVNLGEKNTGGYKIEIVNVEELLDKIVVTIKEKKPEESQIVTQEITNPYCVLKINSKKPIEIK
ncbi:protease complex subunit PrcB family protein [Flavobacterium sp.]|jgi:hypothetical protein|uniref:protease complex subunit PrcB family protein n=1 Tax=Flavobacterium sp. TaxID=239 RepID=UPI0037501B4C